MIGICQICGVLEDLDRCHIRSKGAGGTWDDYNIILMCRKMHQIQHALGWNRFIKLHPAVGLILIEKGWYYDEYKKKWAYEANK